MHSYKYLSIFNRYEQLHGLNEDNINTILTYYTHAKDTDKLCYKAWHAYAYMNFEAILFYKNKADSGKAENGDDTSTPSKKKASLFCRSLK